MFFSNEKGTSNTSFSVEMTTINEEDLQYLQMPILTNQKGKINSRREKSRCLIYQKPKSFLKPKPKMSEQFEKEWNLSVDHDLQNEVDIEGVV